MGSLSVDRNSLLAIADHLSQPALGSTGRAGSALPSASALDQFERTSTPSLDARADGPTTFEALSGATDATLARAADDRLLAARFGGPGVRPTHDSARVAAMLDGKTPAQAKQLLANVPLGDLERLSNDGNLPLEARMLVAGVYADRVATVSSGKVVPGLNERLESASTRSDVDAVDKLLAGAGPEEISALMKSPDLSPKAKAVLVEVCLRRGGNSPHAELIKEKTYTTWRHEGALGNEKTVYETKVDEKATAKDRRLARYQEAAEEAVFDNPDGAEVFVALSQRTSHVGTERPASRLMQVVAQPGGTTSPELLGQMMIHMPPEARGRMSFHLHDAANDSRKGKVVPRGASVQAGVELGPDKGPKANLSIGVEFDYYPKDTPWEYNVKVVVGQVWEDLMTRSEGEACRFENGVRAASRSERPVVCVETRP